MPGEFGTFQREECTLLPEQSPGKAERSQKENVCTESRLPGVDSFRSSCVLAEERIGKMVMTPSWE